MRKKWIAVGAVFVVVLFLTAAVLSEYGEPDQGAVETNKAYMARYQSEDDADWEEVEKEGTVVLENAGYRLELDAQTTRFSVIDKKSGVTYDSYTAEDVNWGSEEVRRRSASNLAVMYYDENHAESYMGAGEDAVDKEQYTIKRQGDTLRILYELGSSAQNGFTPIILPQEIFEERILTQLSSNSDIRSMKRYYTLYTEEKAPGDYTDMVKAYPFLKDTPCYVLTRTTETVIQEVAGYIRQTDYTQEEYESFRDQYGFEDPSMSLPVGYTIPLELTLNRDGFSARVLSDRILVHNPDYPLCSLYLLEFFGCADSTVSGSYLVPDGSGAVIPFNQNGQAPYVQKLYGEDYAQTIDVQQQLSRNAVMPILGRMDDTGGYLLIVEGGAEAASVNVQTAGTLSPVNKGYLTFQMTAAVHTSLGDRRGMSNYILYSKHLLYEYPEIRCVFSDDGGSASALAALYRDYLAGKGVLDYNQPQEEMPLYLDFLCMTTTQEDFLGISYNKKWVLSTLSDIIAAVKELQESGIRNLRVRLKGWTDGGLRHGAFDTCQVDKAVGTAQQLDELSKLLQSGGGQLYLDADFTFSYKNNPFDSFKKARDTVKQLERNVAVFPNFDLVTLQSTNQYEEGYLISPIAYPLYASRFLNRFQQQTAFSEVGLSWSSAGQYLHSDFQVKLDLDRCQSANLMETVLGQMADVSPRLMTDYGNAYTWAYADDIVGVPINCSQFVPEIRSVPFLQMVLSGGIAYAGQPANLSQSDQTLSDLYSSLSAPYFLVITADNQILKKADLQYQYYSLQFDGARVREFYWNMRETLKDCYGKRILDSYTVADNVTETLLDDGSVVVVNHSGDETLVDSGNLPGYGVQVVNRG